LEQKKSMRLLQRSSLSTEPPKSTGSLNTVEDDFQRRNIRIDFPGK
jgi:hypothetical protein